MHQIIINLLDLYPTFRVNINDAGMFDIYCWVESVVPQAVDEDWLTGEFGEYWRHIGHCLEGDDHAFFPSEYTAETGGLLPPELDFIKDLIDRLDMIDRL